MAEKRIPIIIDTDPGVDDFFCLAFGVATPEVFDLKAVTTIGGNNYTSVTTQNALDILKLLHADNVPVAAGHNSYMAAEFEEPVYTFHGRNGLGDMEIAHSDRKPMEKEACDVIYDIAKECEGELVIVPVGPLTNVGLAIQKYPDIVKMIKKITLMGGALKGGNITPDAEANIGHDPEAAHIVFESGIPVDMIGLDVTYKAPVTREDFAPMSENMREDVKTMMEGLIDFRKGEPMHDAVAIATLIDDSFLRWHYGTLKCIQEGEKRGKTVLIQGEGTARAAVRIDLPKYHAIFAKMAAYYNK